MTKLICAQVNEIFRNLRRSSFAEVHPCRSSFTRKLFVQITRQTVHFPFVQRSIYPRFSSIICDEVRILFSEHLKLFIFNISYYTGLSWSLLGKKNRLSNPFFYYSIQSMGINWKKTQRLDLVLHNRNQNNSTQNLEVEKNEFESRFCSK